MPIRNVSKRELCPICGKSDWCTILSNLSSDVYQEVNICRRSGISADVIGRANGKRYAFIKVLSDGSCMYIDPEMQEAARKAWCQKNGQNYRKIRKEAAYEVSGSSPYVETAPLKGSVEPLNHESLNRIYTSFLKKLTLYGRHRAKLQNDGWCNELINLSRIRSIPYSKDRAYMKLRRIQITKELIQEFGSVCGVPGFFCQSDGNWSFTARSSGIFIPILDFKGRIYRLRIRLDYPERDEDGKEKNKYNNFSSSYTKQDDAGDYYNAFDKGCSAGNHIGFYSKEDDDFTVCYITEGEKKALYANYELHCPVISVPGVNSFRKILEILEEGTHVMDYLRARGCKIIIVAYDADKVINEAVLYYEQRLIQFLHEYDFEIAVANWNFGFGKGLDDILKVGVRPNYSLVVM